MKKLLIILSFILLFPFSVSAAKITSSQTTGPSRVEKGDEFEIGVTVNFEGLGRIESKALIYVEFELSTDQKMLIVEDVTADNFNSIYGLMSGKHVVASTIEEDKMKVTQDCVNNIFCNTFKVNMKLYAVGSGKTDIKVGKIRAILSDYNDIEGEVDALEIEYTSNNDDLTINIGSNDIVVEVPTEKLETIDPNAIKKSTPVVTTKKEEPTTTVSTNVSETKEIEEKAEDAKESKEKDEDEDEEEKEKRKKMNKKIFIYAVIVVGTIILLCIVNGIINKIRNRKIDKMLKNL